MEKYEKNKSTFFHLIWKTLTWRMQYNDWTIGDVYDYIFRNKEISKCHKISKYILKRWKGEMPIINEELEKEDNCFKQMFYEYIGPLFVCSVKEMIENDNKYFLILRFLRIDCLLYFMNLI